MIGIGSRRPSWARRAVRALLLLLIAAGLADPAVAQTVTGTIQGTVTDTTAAAVPGVTVVIRNVDTGLVREVVTNELGFYNAAYLPIGRYRLTARYSAGNSGAGIDEPVVDIVVDESNRPVPTPRPPTSRSTTSPRS